ncbi:hypothetical protein CgunFtcFv8_009205 [Champsocephalus gunnari]|uniref:Uncharacterized protein n=1 Tax=Champsocephalus gunnari TaxID=52237 RepID=A0AAN8C3S5_CHAGU|nr:hypothetical protein CgunFtcFv8_009205 [Champsocephalus gunnari]
MLTASLPVPGRQRTLKVHGTRDPATPDQPPQAASSSSSSSSSQASKLEQHQLEDAPSSCTTISIRLLRLGTQEPHLSS